MSSLLLAFAVAGGQIAAPANAELSSMETPEAKAEADTAVAIARYDALEAFGRKWLKAGQYLWRDVPAGGPPRVVISLDDQLAYLYRGGTLVAVSTISSGTKKFPTPTGIFSVLEKKPFHRSIKYDLAPMPHMQRIDKWGIALHGGELPGYPASHGCIRLPGAFAAKLYRVTGLGTQVVVGGVDQFALRQKASKSPEYAGR